MNEPFIPGEKPSVTALLLRRLAALFYDVLVLTGLLMVATFPYLGLLQWVSDAEAAPVGDFWYQAYLTSLILAYVWISWRRAGQTIGMKAWRLQAVSETGKPMSHRQIALRFVVGIPAFLLAGSGYLWVYASPSNQTLPEQCSRTRTQYLPKAGNR